MNEITKNFDHILLSQKNKNHTEGKNLFLQVIPFFILPSIIFVGLVTKEVNPFAFLFVIYVIMPLLDQLFNFDFWNPNKNEIQQLIKNNQIFKVPLYLTILVDWMSFFKVMNYFADFQISQNNAVVLFGVCFIYSNSNSAQFLVAHQIFHKQNLFDRCLGTLHMSKLLYMHFTYEHIFGHHRKVATPDDPASAQQGITVYRFAIRSFIGCYKSVYAMEKEVKKPIYLNYAVLSIFSAFGFVLGVGFIFGLQAMLLFLFCAIGSIFYLQAINYIEHYGLRRKKLSDGSYEKVTIRHSWNAPHRFTNYMLYKLQRHSDHHQNCLKPYQTLLTLEESPHLPHGYGLIVTMCLFPKVWFRVMDPLVEEYKRLNIGNINGEVMSKAIQQVRRFCIELVLSMIILCFFSNLLVD